jgi:hypothetical protein
MARKKDVKVRSSWIAAWCALECVGEYGGGGRNGARGLREWDGVETLTAGMEVKSVYSQSVDKLIWESDGVNGFLPSFRRRLL